MNRTLMSDTSIYKQDFDGAEKKFYLNTAAEGLLLKNCRKAFGDYLAAKAMGAVGRPQLYERDRECKRQLAEMLDVNAKEIAILSNASEGINRLAQSIDWRTGIDEVVINDLEFPSNVLPWLKLQRQGVKVHVIESEDWTLSPSDFCRYINSNTRLVSVSHVSYMTGARLDISEIGRMAHEVGAVFAVDATQSMGRVPVPMEEIDYLVASTYKWLASPHGGGIVFCRQDFLDSFEPAGVGWWSVADLFSADRFEKYELKDRAERFELGMPNFPVVFGIEEAVRYLNTIGVDTIAADLEPLCNYLVEELIRLGVKLMTPIESSHRAGIVSFLHDACEDLANSLARDHDVHVWGGDGRIRVSVHLYNDREDVDAFLRGLSKLL